MKEVITAEHVCRNYASLAVEIRRLTRFLRDNRCPEESGGDHITPAVPSCLDEFFAAPKGPGGEFPRRHEFYERMCDTCKAKLAVIDTRRECKRMLGAAKRTIERIGKRPEATA